MSASLVGSEMCIRDSPCRRPVGRDLGVRAWALSGQVGPVARDRHARAAALSAATWVSGAWALSGQVGLVAWDRHARAAALSAATWVSGPELFPD
eukprot:9084867-Alexandrium_andersonii.AAC.1